MFELFKAGHARTGLPMVRVSSRGFALNGPALALIGEKAARALLLYDKEARTVGFWFFTNGPKVQVPHPEAVFRLVRHKAQRTGRISCKAFVEWCGGLRPGAYRLTRAAVTEQSVGAEPFFDNGTPTGKDFFTINVPAED